MHQEIDVRLSAMLHQKDNLCDWLIFSGGFLQECEGAGRNLEDVVAGALCLGLNRHDIDPSTIRMRQKIHDPTGLVFQPGKQKEVDMVVQNGELLVFEVKSAPKPDDVDNFADKVELVRVLNPDKQTTGVFVALGVENDVREQCRVRELILIP